MVASRFTVTCEICGKVETVRPCDAKRYRTCSLACRGRLSSRELTTRVEKICETCGNPFLVKPSHYDSRRTCSRKCRSYDHLIHGKGEDSRGWKGGRFLTPSGYVKVYCPDSVMSDSRGYVREHRLVMANSIGRPLTRDEEVHHIDGNKSNNDISNLMLLTKAEHSRLHGRLRRGRKSLSLVNIKVKKIHPDAVLPIYATDGSAGFDLAALEDCIVAPGETKLVRTGLAFEIPDGYEMQIRPRSGVTLKTKLRVGNAPGTIDADYRGEVAVIVDCLHDSAENVYTDGRLIQFARDISGKTVKIDDYVPDGSYIIRKGDRIAQGVIAPVVRASFVEVAELGETERGDGGFGSTGINAEVGANGF